MHLSSARNRIRLLASLLFLLFLILAIRLCYLHLWYDAPENRNGFKRTVYAKRGSIYDRNGNCLADDIPVRRVILDRDRCGTNLNDVVSGLAPLLGLSFDELNQRIPSIKTTPRCHYVNLGIVREGSAISELSTNRLFRSPRVTLQTEFERTYILGNHASQLLGFTANANSIGICGIERKFNRMLVGSNGWVRGFVDASKKEIRDRRCEDVAAVDGCNIELTIDQTIQNHTENALDAVLAKYGFPRAWAVVMRCSTGEILSMATRPSPNPNGRKSEYNPEDWRNCPVSNTYDPGSTMKALTVAAALNENAITPEMSFNCEYGAWPYGGKILHDSHSYGVLSVPYVLKKSSNIGSAKIALLLGNEKLYNYLLSAGFAKKTGIELPDENPGMLNEVRKWSKIDITRIAIGHSITVTALQMVALYSAIANGGQLMKPTLVRKITAPDGTVLRAFSPTPVGDRIFSRQTAVKMRTMLEGVTAKDGTGRRAKIPGYPVAGKTGTAQKLVRSVDENGRLTGGLQYAAHLNISSFCGFLPADNPEIAIIVVVDETTKDMGGGLVAAPVFAEIGMQTARYLDIPSAFRIVETLPVWEDSRADLEMLREIAP